MTRSYVKAPKGAHIMGKIALSSLLLCAVLASCESANQPLTPTPDVALAREPGNCAMPQYISSHSSFANAVPIAKRWTVWGSFPSACEVVRVRVFATVVVGTDAYGDIPGKGKLIGVDNHPVLKTGNQNYWSYWCAIANQISANDFASSHNGDPMIIVEAKFADGHQDEGLSLMDADAPGSTPIEPRTRGRGHSSTPK